MNRRRRLVAAMALLAAAPRPARSQQQAIVFDLERYVRVHRERQSSGDQIVQFVPEGETLADWTRSIAIYRYTALGDDPARAALELRESVRAANPDAQSRIQVHTVTDDAVLDFLTWPPDGRYLEFNVMRYAKVARGKGLVALRFVYRSADARKELSEQFKESRLSWVRQVADFDLIAIYAVLDN